MSFGQVLLGLDRTLNAITGGYSAETLSARAHRCRFESSTWARVEASINLLFFWMRDANGVRNHCEQAFNYMMAGAELPAIYRQRER